MTGETLEVEDGKDVKKQKKKKNRKKIKKQKRAWRGREIADNREGRSEFQVSLKICPFRY